MFVGKPGYRTQSLESVLSNEILTNVLQYQGVILP